MATVPAPRTWVPGDALTAARMNTELRDALTFFLNRPRTRLRQSVVQSVASSTWAPVTWDIEDFDTDNMHSGTNSYLVAVTAGLYQVDAVVAFASTTPAAGASIGQRGCRLEIYTSANPVWSPVPGRSMTPNMSQGATAVATGVIDVDLSRTLYLNVGDQVRVAAYQTSGAAVSTAATADSCSFLDLTWISQ